MAQTWTTLTQAVQLYLENAPVTSLPTADLTAAFPTIIGNAELRIYRDIPFLATHGQNSSLSMTAGARTFALTAMTGQLVGGFATAYPYPVNVESIAAILPQGDAPAAGTRVYYLPSTLAWIDAVWPQESLTQAPVADNCWFVMRDDVTAILAPTPDQAYTAEVTGMWRPAPMSAAVPETWLGDKLGDLLHVACMVEAEGYIRNFSAASDDPQTPVGWKRQYESLLPKVIVEEARRRGIPPPAPPPGPPRA